MQDDLWARLAASFPSDALRWRVVDVAVDGRSARVVPELAAAAVRARFDDVLGAAGWSNRYLPFPPDAVGCELTALGVTKSAVVAAARGPAASAAPAADLLADSALSAAALGFGLRAPADDAPEYWVDYDPDAGEALHPPVAQPPEAVAAPVAAAAADPDAAAPKSEGQIAIDRLVERLKAEGRGLETAKLLVEYGGYGRDPEQARELYSRLRKLLLEAEPS